MGTITVEFFLPIREVAAEKQHNFCFDRECLSLGDLLRMIVVRFGPALEHSLFDSQSNQLKSMIMVAVNGRNAFLLDGMKTSLVDGDKVAIGVVSAGG